jgi:hypothetical protein
MPSISTSQNVETFRDVRQYITVSSSKGFIDDNGIQVLNIRGIREGSNNPNYIKLHGSGSANAICRYLCAFSASAISTSDKDA